MATQVKTDLIANNAITDAKIANVAITGVTASSGDSSTALATTAFVAGEINSLIDSAPGALNTLNELAAAMGDDANFSTTVTNNIATKLPITGGTLTGALTMSVSPTVNNARLLVQRANDDSSIAFANNASGTPSSHTWAIGLDYSASNGLAIAYSASGIPSLTGNKIVQISTSGNIFIGSEGKRISTDGNGELGIGYNQTATSNIFTVYNGTADALRVKSNGNVGINQSSPAAKLDIKGDTSTYGGMAKIYLTDTASNSESRNWAIGNGGSGYGHFTIGRSVSKNGDPMASGTHTVPFMIDHQDNIGFGMAPVAGVGLPLQMQASTGYVGLRLNGTGSAGIWDLYSSYGNGVKYFGVYDRAATSYRLVTTENGNVGIGTSTPRRQLHVHNTGSGTTNLMITNSVTGESNDSQGLQLGVGSGGQAYIDNKEATDLQIISNGATKIVVLPVSQSNAHVDINSGLNVGVGNDGRCSEPGRNVKGWYVAEAHTYTSGYMHLSTTLWGGAQPTGNSQYIMGGWEITGHQYASGASHGKCNVFFHNWNGSVNAGFSLNYTGAYTGWCSVYVNSSGYVTIRLDGGSYKAYWLDLYQAPHYPVRNINVSAVTNSASSTI